VSPEKVLKALKKKAKGESPRVGPDKFPEIPWPEATRVAPPLDGGDGKGEQVTAQAPERQH
jgi:hypothetical protein